MAILERVIRREVLHCDRCGHEWKRANHDKLPAVCPSCKTRRWNVTRTNGQIETPKLDRE